MGVRVSVLAAALLLVTTVASTAGQEMYSKEWYDRFRGPMSAPAEPFKVVGTIYYVGAADISSWLITTPEGHVLIDTGTVEMHDVIRKNIEALGFNPRDVEIILSTEAQFDHVAGHAAMQKLTGARVMAMRGDAEALSTGTDTSALGAVGWDPVKVDRMLEHGDTVAIGGTTLRAVHNPGHTQGTTTWMMTVEDGGRRYNVAILGSMLPDWGVSLIKNPRHKNVVADTRLGLSRLKAEKAPDIVLRSHAQSFFEGKIEQIKAGVRPHALLNGDEWMSDIMEAETDLERAVWAEEQGS
jgi:metallo-beta-lactamase class B